MKTHKARRAKRKFCLARSSPKAPYHRGDLAHTWGANRDNTLAVSNRDRCPRYATAVGNRLGLRFEDRANPPRLPNNGGAASLQDIGNRLARQIITADDF